MCVFVMMFAVALKGDRDPMHATIPVGVGYHPYASDPGVWVVLV